MKNSLRLFLLPIVCSLAVGLSEVSARVFLKDKFLEFDYLIKANGQPQCLEFDENLGYKPIFGKCGRSEFGFLSTKSISTEKENSTFRVISLGDSIAEDGYYTKFWKINCKNCPP